jgi:hypothetical protein
MPAGTTSRVTALANRQVRPPRLQSASTSGKPVAEKVNYDNGHFTEEEDL